METKSSSAVLMEQGTGNILFENNADEQMPAAGCAKVMTMLLVFEAIDDGRLTLDEQITVSQTAASMAGTQAFLEANASYKAEDLLKGSAWQAPTTRPLPLPKSCLVRRRLWCRR